MTHPLAWLTWLCASTISIWSSRNPYMLALLMLILGVVRSAYPQRDGLAPPAAAFWFIPIAAFLNALWTRAGDTVLMELSLSVPLIGGQITAEALVYGALNGAALLAIFNAFAVLQRAVPVAEMIAVVPRALHPVAVVVVIAVTYVPFARRQARAVRDAQAVRGHSVRSIRDWLPLLMPLLVGALEHAMQLAEAMSARGYGRSTNGRQHAPLMSLIGGTLAALAGWVVRAMTDEESIGWIITGCGTLLIAISLWMLRSNAPRTSYRRRKLRAADWVGIAGACLAMIAVWLPIPGADMLTWTPYPLLRWPDFSPIIGIMTCGLCAPAVFSSHTMHDHDEASR